MANPGTDVSFDLTTANGQLKQYYRKIEFEKLVYEHMPAVGIVPKDEDLQGENWKQPVAFAPSPNRSATFTYGQNPWFYASNGTANQSLTQSSVTGIGFPQVTAFVVTPVQDYGFGYIDRMTKMLSETSEGAFEDTAVTAMSMAMKAVMLSLGNAIYGTGTGTIGQISAGSNVASPTITLNDPNQVVNFYVGQVVVATATDGGAVKGGNTQGCGALIVAIDRNLGTLTVGTALGSGTTAPTTANWSTLINGNGGTAVVAGDYLCQAGDAANAGTYLKIAGFGAWVPASAVASTDSFFGVNRYADTFLSGVRINGVGLEIEEALMEGAAAGARQGALLDTCLMNFANWTVLQYALTARKTYFQNVDAKVMSSDGNIGYSTIKIEGPTGTIDVIPDPFCPSTQIFILQKDTWSLKTVGKAVSPFDFNTEKPSSMDDEKATLLRTVNSDSYEFRCGMYGNLSCSAPGWNVNITVTAPSVL